MAFYEPFYPYMNVEYKYNCLENNTVNDIKKQYENDSKIQTVSNSTFLSWPRSGSILEMASIYHCH